MAHGRALAESSAARALRELFLAEQNLPPDNQFSHLNLKTTGYSRAFLLVAVASLLSTMDTWALDGSKAITQYHQDFWSEESGLPQTSVQAITQTREGYIWIGTRDGLARFDGHKFTIYRDEDHPGLRSNDIRSLCEDNQGRLWIGTFNGGVALFQNGTFKSYGAENGLPSNGVLDILQDSHGTIWFGTWGGVARFNRGSFDAFGEEEGLIGRNGWSFCQDPKGQVWLATARAVHFYNEGRFHAHADLRGFTPHNLQEFHIDKNGAFWLGTVGGGLIRHQKGEQQTFTMEEGLADNRVRALAEDGDGSIWVGTWNGLSRLRDGVITSLPNSSSKVSGFVESLFFDREGSLWVGMRGRGLARIRDAQFSSYTPAEGLPSHFPRCIYPGRDGSVWIGTDGGGLTRLHHGKFQSMTSSNGLPSDYVWSIAEDKSGGIWAGLARPSGVAIARKEKVEAVFTQKTGLPVQHGVRAIFVDSKDRVWAGGDSGGLCRYTNGTWERIPEIQSTLIRMITEDSTGNIWVGGGEGLARMRDGKVEVFTTKDGLAHNSVYALWEENDGTIWLGTQRGLTRFRDNEFRSFTSQEGVFDGTIFLVLKDPDERLWMSSSRGIFAIESARMEELVQRKIGKVESATFGIRDGLISSQCEGGSQWPGCRTQDGRLWFATSHGVAATPAKREPAKTAPPPVLIESTIADGTALESQSLPAETDNFEFHYTAVQFTRPERVQFRYRLEGHDPSWVSAGTRRVAYYNNLPPGEFRFLVSASLDGMNWSKPGESAPFTLQPHFYQTSWFYALCALVVTACGWGFHRHRMTKAQDRFALILTERTRIARDLHDTLAQGFAGIAFQLQALGSRLKNAPPETRRHLDLALNMVRHSLRESKRAVLNLRSPLLEQGNLLTAVEELANQLFSETGITFQITTHGDSQALDPQVEQEILRLCQEAFSNIVRHAKASRVELSIDFRKNPGVLTISDNGIGFEPDNPATVAEHHFGLLGMTERVKRIGGDLKITSSPGAGTSISISF